LFIISVKGKASVLSVLNQIAVKVVNIALSDDFLFYVKKRLPVENRRKLTKFVFYEIGLIIAIEDFNQKGEESSLWKAIQEQVSGLN
jgi:hypothetical protein